MNKTIYLLDSNAIIHSDNSEKCTVNIKDHIKGKNPKFVITSQVSMELRFDKHTKNDLGENKLKVWSGIDEKRIREKLKNKFGVAVKFYTLENNISEKANQLFDRYHELELEHSDALLLASMIVKKWNEIITNDTKLKQCCEKENVDFFDHRR